MRRRIALTFDVPIEELKRIAVGHEGVVFTDDKKIYKVFFCRLTNVDILIKVSALSQKCSVVMPFDVIKTPEFDIVSHPFLASTSHAVSLNEIKEFLIECKKIGVLFWDFKKENFIESNGKGKLVDYGISFEPYNETVFKQSCVKAYLMVRQPDMKPWTFKHIAKQIDDDVYSESVFEQHVIEGLKQENYIDSLFG